MVYRVSIAYENKLYYTIGKGLRIYKSKMCCGERWSLVYYMVETPELLQEFQETQLKLKFRHTLADLKNCTDLKLMHDIIERVALCSRAEPTQEGTPEVDRGALPISSDSESK
jgi:hypothetical protein